MATVVQNLKILAHDVVNPKLLNAIQNAIEYIIKNGKNEKIERKNEKDAFLYLGLSPSGKGYVGQTVQTVSKRWRQHK